MKKKALAILLSILMLTSVTLPGTWATDETEETTAVTDVVETETETDETEPEPEEETFDPYAAVEYLYTLGSNEEIVAYLQSLTEDELAAVQAILEEYGMWADIAAMLYPEESPEGMPPEDWGSTFLEGAVPFTNAVSMFSLIPRESGSNNGDPGVVLNKTAKANANGGFDITLEAYATGAQTTVSGYEPADIVLVLDTSGSMYAGMQNSDFEPVYDTSSNSFSVTASSDYYTKYRKYWIINDDGEYVNACYYANQKWTTQDAWNENSTFAPKTRQNDQQSGNKQFYVVKSGQSRMDSLKTSVNSFISNVFTTSADSSIAIVPFGTNVGTITGFTSDHTVLSNAVAALTPDGATDSGAAMAKAVELLNSDTVKDNGREKVVVMFTDGSPCSTGNTFDNLIANAAISNSNTLKANGVTVYTVGVFAGANGEITSVGSSNENTYMHYVSSNYPEATSMTASGDQNTELNGMSYYLSATNSLQLLNIFQLISQQVGGATNSTLGTSTVVKDIIAPSFTVPANASDIKLYTANCTGAGLTFGNRTPATGVIATITGDTLDVTGFDFSANWCGSHSGTYSGQKLIIEFTVSPKEGFLGGNDVPTNGNTSGMYLNGTAVALFEVPQVNVPIADVNVTATDKNVYLLGSLTAEKIKSGATAKCGDVVLNLGEDATNYGLADWQNAYVDITVAYTDASGNTVTNLSDLKDDIAYTVAVTVAPKNTTPTSTDVTAKTNSAKVNINVFVPTLTYKDSTVYYGDTAPTDYSNHLTNTEWKHGNTLSTDSTVTMIGTAPTLDLTYTPGAGVDNGKIATKADIPVAVTVKIGTTDVTGNTTFVHTKCDANETDPTDGKFWLHVETCSLTITKAASGTTIGNDEYFVFNVKKDGNPYTQVTIQGTGSVTISELPVGTYTIEEDTSTAWRYTSSMSSSSATLSSTTTFATVTCTNTKKNDHWLNFFNRVINTFGVEPSTN